MSLRIAAHDREVSVGVGIGVSRRAHSFRTPFGPAIATCDEAGPWLSLLRGLVPGYRYPPIKSYIQAQVRHWIHLM